MGPYNPAETPSTSADFKAKNGGAGHHSSLKTSTELIKVLNRIWTLEEHHASNVSQVKDLRMELDHSRTRIKELLRLQQADKHEIADLRNKIAEDKLVGKNKEHDRVIAAVHSVRSELEDEKKLRKRSETLHRKLAGELLEAKKSLANSLKDVDKERKSRVLLEDLCDELSRGIKRYEEEMHVMKVMKQRNGAYWGDRSDQSRLVLHLAESWLDQRMQMNENSNVVERFGSEMENYFLQARSSLESIQLNTIVSAPRDVGGEDEDPSSGDSHCFEFMKPSSSALKNGENTEKPKFPSSEVKSEVGHEEANNTKIRATASSSGNSPWRGMASPIRQWTARLPSQELDTVQSSLKLSPSTEPRENSTLKEKLLEARARGQHSRLKASKSPS